MFNVETIRRDFPLLQRKVHDKPIIWLDNAATTQKPQTSTHWAAVILMQSVDTNFLERFLVQY